MILQSLATWTLTERQEYAKRYFQRFAVQFTDPADAAVFAAGFPHRRLYDSVVTIDIDGDPGAVFHLGFRTARLEPQTAAAGAIVDAQDCISMGDYDMDIVIVLKGDQALDALWAYQSLVGERGVQTFTPLINGTHDGLVLISCRLRAQIDGLARLGRALGLRSSVLRAELTWRH
jgi:hypothetical protein